MTTKVVKKDLSKFNAQNYEGRLRQKRTRSCKLVLCQLSILQPHCLAKTRALMARQLLNKWREDFEHSLKNQTIILFQTKPHIKHLSELVKHLISSNLHKKTFNLSCQLDFHKAYQSTGSTLQELQLISQQLLTEKLPTLFLHQNS